MSTLARSMVTMTLGATDAHGGAPWLALLLAALGLTFVFVITIGVVTMVVLFPVHVVACRRSGVPWRRDRLRIVARTQSVVDGAAPQVFEGAMGAVSGIAGFRIRSVNAGDLVMEARHRGSWKSVGERLRLQFVSIDDTHTEVHVESRPRLRTTLLDYGRNADNVRLVMAAVQPIPS